MSFLTEGRRRKKKEAWFQFQSYLGVSIQNYFKVSFFHFSLFFFSFTSRIGFKWIRYAIKDSGWVGAKHTIRSSLSKAFARLTSSAELDVNESLSCATVAFKATSSNFFDSSSLLDDSNKHF